MSESMIFFFNNHFYNDSTDIHNNTPATENRTLNIAASVSDPYVLFNKTSLEWSGILVNFLKTACHRLTYKCEFELTEVPGNEKTIDESLLGVFGKITNGTADAGVSPISITAKRFKHFTFIDSFLRRTYVAVIHENHLVSADPSHYIIQLLEALVQDEVWIGLGATLCIIVLYGTLSELVVDNYQKKQSTSFFPVLTQWGFRVFGTGLGIQGIDDFGESGRCSKLPLSKITFLLTWMIYTFFILCALTGALPSLFTFGINQQLPFSTMKELMDSKFLSYSSSTLISSLNISKDKVRTTLARQIRLLPDGTATKTKYERYVEIAKNKRSVLIIDLDALLEISYFNCEMIVAIDEVESLPIAALVMAKDSPLQPFFEYGYSTVKEIGFGHMGIRDLGLFMTSKARHHAKSKQLSNCYRRKLDTGPMVKEHSLHLETLQFLFWFFVGGLSVAFLALLSEIITDRLKAAFSMFNKWRRVRNSAKI